MAGTSRRDRAALALDVVVAVSIAVAAVRAVELALIPGLALRTAGYVLALAAAVVVWLGWRRETRSAAVREGRLAAHALIYTALTGSLFFIGDQPLGLPLFVVGLIMLQRSYGLRSGVIAIGALLVAQTVLYVSAGRHRMETAAEVGASALLYGFSLLIAWLFAEIDRQRRDTEALAIQVQRRSGVEAELASIRERQRAARDLHDGIGHQVTVISMSLQFAERVRERDPARAWAEVTRAREQASTALSDIRRLARALHPPGVGTAGAADLSALAGSFAGTGLAVTVADEAVGLVLPETLAVFRQRFVQEGLTNVVRHSSATGVTVGQHIANDQLILSVVDNGRSSEKVAPGFGLSSLTERAQELDGAIVVDASPTGWAMTATVPLRPGEGS